MNDLITSPPVSNQAGLIISWQEKRIDEEAKVDEFILNCLFRGFSATTVTHMKSALHKTLDRVRIDDPTHPEGRRRLLAFEVMDPVLGPIRLGQIIDSLMQSNLAWGTCRSYMNNLRQYCEYVFAKPNIPGSDATFVQKYGPMSITFTKYDLPVHAQDRPERNRYALSPPLTHEFYEFLRTDYLPSHALPHIGARNYTAVVLQTEIGARRSELLSIQLGGDRCDIDDSRSRIRLLGKAKAYGGKRARWVPLSQFAEEVLHAFEKVFRPMFPNASQCDHLFLSEDGSPLTGNQYGKCFRKMVDMAVEAGVPVPVDLRTHDLRRTCATNRLEKDPLSYRKTLKMLGHSYPSSAAPYLIATDDDVEEAQSDLIDIFVDPYINKRGSEK